MPNNLKTAITARNAALDAIAPLANTGYIRIYDGTQAATPPELGGYLVAGKAGAMGASKMLAAMGKEASPVLNGILGGAFALPANIVASSTIRKIEGHDAAPFDPGNLATDTLWAIFHGGGQFKSARAKAVAAEELAHRGVDPETPTPPAKQLEKEPTNAPIQQETIIEPQPVGEIIPPEPAVGARGEIIPPEPIGAREGVVSEAGVVAEAGTPPRESPRPIEEIQPAGGIDPRAAEAGQGSARPGEGTGATEIPTDLRLERSEPVAASAEGREPTAARPDGLDRGGRVEAPAIPAARLSEPDLLGSSGGQNDLAIYAYDKTGKKVGAASWSVYEDVPRIDYVDVLPEAQRKGIGTQLLNAVQAQHPGAPIQWTYASKAGEALRRAYERQSLGQEAGQGITRPVEPPAPITTPLISEHPLLSARKIPELEGVKIPDGSERVMIEGTPAEIPRQRDAGEAWKETNNRKSLFQAFIDCMAAA